MRVHINAAHIMKFPPSHCRFEKCRCSRGLPFQFCSKPSRASVLYLLVSENINCTTVSKSWLVDGQTSRKILLLRATVAAVRAELRQKELVGRHPWHGVVCLSATQKVSPKYCRRKHYRPCFLFLLTFNLLVYSLCHSK